MTFYITTCNSVQNDFGSSCARMLFEYHSLAQYGIDDVLLTLAALLSGNGAKEEIIKELLVGSRLLLNNAERKLSSYWMCLVTFCPIPILCKRIYTTAIRIYIFTLCGREGYRALRAARIYNEKYWRALWPCRRV
jgi:hypothetical protein